MIQKKILIVETPTYIFLVRGAVAKCLEVLSRLPNTLVLPLLGGLGSLATIIGAWTLWCRSRTS